MREISIVPEKFLRVRKDLKIDEARPETANNDYTLCFLKIEDRGRTSSTSYNVYNLFDYEILDVHGAKTVIQIGNCRINRIQETYKSVINGDDLTIEMSDSQDVVRECEFYGKGIIALRKGLAEFERLAKAGTWEVLEQETKRDNEFARLQRRVNEQNKEISELKAELEKLKTENPSILTDGEST